MSKNKFNKRFWLFGMDDYYPSGGIRDFIDSFDALEDAIEEIKQQLKEDTTFDRCHILDVKTGTLKLYRTYIEEYKSEDLEGKEILLRHTLSYNSSETYCLVEV